MPANKSMELVAAEALKPASKVIDALLGPKLERIQTWAKKRELKGRVETNSIRDLLDDYWRQIASRASGINTLAFPNEVIELPKIYEPLKLKKPNSNQPSIMITISDLEPGKNYLIIDTAGMGKSTFSKYLILDAIRSKYWQPLFLELRRVDDTESLLGRLSKDIDPSQNDINEDVLPYLLEQGNYLIILDGYDELLGSARKKIGLQIAALALKNEKNIIVLTSRPEVGIPEIVNSTVYNIQPLDRKQAESLILRYDSIYNFIVGKGLIKEFDHVSEEFLETPLLLVLLYSTYKHTQTIATKLTTFYNHVYDAFYWRHDRTKSGFQREKLSGLEVEDFRRLLRGVAFLLIADNKYTFKNETEAHAVIEKATLITSIKLASVSRFFTDMLTTVPLIVKDGDEFRFIHKSICEFFAAEYLVYVPDAENKIRKICESSLLRNFDKSFDFLADIDASLFQRSVLEPFAKEFLAKKNAIKDPFLRTLYFTGITKVAINHLIPIEVHSEARTGRSGITVYTTSGFVRRSGPLKQTTREKVHLIQPRLKNLKEELIIVLIEGRDRYATPSKAWELLGRDYSEELGDLYTTGAYRDEEVEELLGIKDVSSITGKEVIKISNNRIFRLAVRERVPSPIRVIISDEICKAVLKQAQEERQRENVLDTIISGK